VLPLILGAGYAGLVLGERLRARGLTVRASTTRADRRAALAARGLEPHVVDLSSGEGLAGALDGATHLVFLAPPVAGQAAEALAARLAEAGAQRLARVVYGSTTGVYGAHAGVVDESTPPAPTHARGRARLDVEAALAALGPPITQVRIAGIYGPGRTLAESLRGGRSVLVDGAPTTSRVHVLDLARLLERALDDDAPPIVLAADGHPAPTAEVARYTASLLGLPMPTSAPLEEAARVLSPLALEMRLGGHAIVPRETARLLPDGLVYPSYVEGVRASLEAEGLLAPR
jgi:nucleoside-diphosphate-sugar epimerase